MPDDLVAQLAQGPDGALIQPPVLGDAMMMGPGGVPMVNPAMMRPGAMECGPDGSYGHGGPRVSLLPIWGSLHCGAN